VDVVREVDQDEQDEASDGAEAEAFRERRLGVLHARDRIVDRGASQARSSLGARGNVFTRRGLAAFRSVFPRSTAARRPLRWAPAAAGAGVPALSARLGPSLASAHRMRRKQPTTFVEDRSPEHDLLLQRKISELGLRLEGTVLEKLVRELEREVKAAGIGKL